MATINFLYRSTKDKANLHLRLLYRFNDKDFVFGTNTKFEVTKHYWSKQHKKKSKDLNITNQQSDTNTELNKIENHILNAFNSVNPDEVNKEWLQTQIDYYYNPPQQTEALPKELINYIDYYSEVKKNEVTESTIKKNNVNKQLLSRYELHYKKNILITDINTKFKTNFENYCLMNGYAPNTIARAIRFVKTICKHAKASGLETSNQLDNIKVKYLKVDSIYLTFDELEKIENIKKSKLTESLENAKDWLIISCYTGQRVSDFMRFKKDMIRIEDGKHLIEFTQKKTGKIMTVPLHPKVLDILNKRNGMFPYAISDQKYNDYIKDVCEIAKLNQLEKGSKLKETKPKSKIYRKETGMYKKFELVTSHIGRRSFATNFYGKIPTSYLIYVTGHSTEVMFLNYIGKSNKDIAMEMTNFF
ncbi:integrase [Lutibacter sp. HS1-25]|uniref:tyrosine-type recombinase/integrase n=1 Tax=Lutibacter sp. HS1-25 TaxID=2485000 RepID=UPI00101324E0|nr:phage integrase SAM-like domain-containing protein [Lutibacter sp. HS1-25]RXP46876.1 integrase [Lutibacter sp. HS1-25]